MAMRDQSSVFDAGLKERLGKGTEEPLPVIVTFSQAIPKSALDTLGLYASTGEESTTIGYGTLAPAAVRRLGSRADVASISLAAVLPQRANSTPAPAGAIDKIQSILLARLNEQPNERHPVIVYFQRPVPPETLDALDLSEIDRDAGKGRLDRAAILRLAERADVRRIEMIPEMRLYTP